MEETIIRLIIATALVAGIAWAVREVWRTFKEYTE